MKKKILILGAGFAGIRCVQDLVKKLPADLAEITLVDRNDFHIFHPDLYEIATAFSKQITKECLTRLKDTIAIPIADLINTERVKFIQDEVISISKDKMEVRLKKKLLKYDYLVVAIGSVTNYFGIPGMEKYAFPMKQVSDALTINCHLDQLFHNFWSKGSLKKDVFINVGGGGATGVETAAELVGSLSCLSLKYRYPRNLIHLSLIEGTGSLAVLDKKGTEIVAGRLKKLGVKIYFQKFIERVEKKKVYLKGGEVIDSDILIWTGGVMVNPVVQKSLGSPQHRGAIEVNQFLQSKSNSNIFAAGDNAFYSKSAGMFAQVAYQEGKCVAENLRRLVLGETKLQRFKFTQEYYLLPLGGTYAIWRFRGHYFRGFWVWAIRRMVFFRYALSVLPFHKALARLFRGTRIFIQND